MEQPSPSTDPRSDCPLAVWITDTIGVYTGVRTVMCAAVAGLEATPLPRTSTGNPLPTGSKGWSNRPHHRTHCLRQRKAAAPTAAMQAQRACRHSLSAVNPPVTANHNHPGDLTASKLLAQHEPSQYLKFEVETGVMHGKRHQHLTDSILPTIRCIHTYRGNQDPPEAWTFVTLLPSMRQHKARTVHVIKHTEDNAAGALLGQGWARQLGRVGRHTEYNPAPAPLQFSRHDSGGRRHTLHWQEPTEQKGRTANSNKQHRSLLVCHTISDRQTPCCQHAHTLHELTLHTCPSQGTTGLIPQSS